MVANGEAEIGVHLIQELMSVAGIDIVGPLPGDLQDTTCLFGGNHDWRQGRRRREGAGRFPAHAGVSEGHQGEGHGTRDSVKNSSTDQVQVEQSTKK